MFQFETESNLLEGKLIDAVYRLGITIQCHIFLNIPV